MIRPWEFLEAYDPEPFAFSRAQDVEEMDAVDMRHLQVLYALAAEIRPRAAVEIVAAGGRSSGMFIAMLNAGFCQEVHFIEPHPSHTLRAVLALAHHSRHVHLHACTPDAAPWIEADFCLIDSPKPAQDLARVLRFAPTVISMHDTNADKARKAGEKLRANPDYLAIDDHALRHDEFTERGLTVALRKRNVSADVIELTRDLLAADLRWWEKQKAAK